MRRLAHDDRDESVLHEGRGKLRSARSMTDPVGARQFRYNRYSGL